MRLLHERDGRCPGNSLRNPTVWRWVREPRLAFRDTNNLRSKDILRYRLTTPDLSPSYIHSRQDWAVSVGASKPLVCPSLARMAFQRLQTLDFISNSGIPSYAYQQHTSLVRHQLGIRAITFSVSTEFLERLTPDDQAVRHCRIRLLPWYEAAKAASSLT